MKYAQDYAEQVGLGEYKLNIVSQIHQENGAWNETRRGDAGCSVGLTQLNTCVRKSIANHPELYNWEWQIRALVDEVNANYEKYKNIDRAQVGWNHPAAMRSGKYKTKYYYKMQDIRKLFTLTP